MRFLGIDFGERRIGLAISDADARVATPLSTIRRSSDAQAIAEIVEIIDTEGVERLVVGEPRRLDGSRGEAAQRVASFARKLQEASGLEVALVDESLTSREAASRLGSADHEHLDAVAAQIILQDALEREVP